MFTSKLLGAGLLASTLTIAAGCGTAASHVSTVAHRNDATTSSAHDTPAHASHTPTPPVTSAPVNLAAQAFTLLQGTWSGQSFHSTLSPAQGQPGVLTTDLGGTGTPGPHEIMFNGVQAGSGQLEVTYDFAASRNTITVNLMGDGILTATRSSAPGPVTPEASPTTGPTASCISEMNPVLPPSAHDVSLSDLVSGSYQGSPVAPLPDDAASGMDPTYGPPSAVLAIGGPSPNNDPQPGDPDETGVLSIENPSNESLGNGTHFVVTASTRNANGNITLNATAFCNEAWPPFLSTPTFSITTTSPPSQGVAPTGVVVTLPGGKIMNLANYNNS
jgi:hypothetical protein